uniref:Uncharacterized protein n=1 Tax=Oryza barthii TaxID=65489 RepID=A0A0D3FT69_9ORYZ
MEEKSMRGRALRPPTSASLSSDSLYDFMAAQLVVVLSLSWGLGLAGSGVWRGDAARGCALPGRKLISSSSLRWVAGRSGSTASCEEGGLGGEELVGEEEQAVGRRGGAEEARDGGVVAVAEDSEAGGDVRLVAAERAAEDRGGVATEGAAEQRGRTSPWRRRRGGGTEEKLAVAAASSWKVRRSRRSGRESWRAWSKAVVEEEVAEKKVEYWVAAGSNGGLAATEEASTGDRCRRRANLHAAPSSRQSLHLHLRQPPISSPPVTPSTPPATARLSNLGRHSSR